MDRIPIRSLQYLNIVQGVDCLNGAEEFHRSIALDKGEPTCDQSCDLYSMAADESVRGRHGQFIAGANKPGCRGQRIFFNQLAVKGSREPRTKINSGGEG